MDFDDRPPKRARMTPETQESGAIESNADFVAFEQETGSAHGLPTGPRRHKNGDPVQQRVDTRNKFDRPKSKHALDSSAPWVLVRTKLGRRFVHNTATHESFWRIPEHLKAAIAAYDDREEKKGNANWAEQQLRQMRSRAAPAPAEHTLGDEHLERQRRRRSESLQREDEQAALAELEAGAVVTHEDRPLIAAGHSAEARGYLGEASDSEYEYVEVTDSEGEHDAGDGDDDDDNNNDRPQPTNNPEQADTQPQGVHDSAPVEFGEDDIAHQLAMLGEEYGLDPDEYGYSDDDGQQAEDAPLSISVEEATALFHEMLDEHGTSPFTPWDKVIADTTSTGVVLDGRYTLLSSSKARKDAWDHWSRDRAAQIQIERANQQRKDPRINYLDFLSRHASTKLYWPEFKRKFKREPELNDRALQDKDREKLYRDLILKLKSPESQRKNELQVLVKSLPRSDDDRPLPLPEKVLISAVYHSLPPKTREDVLGAFGYHDSLIET